MNRVEKLPGIALQPQVVAVQDAWLDHNGHVNASYYVLMFTEAITGAMDEVALGPAYTVAGAGTFMAVEINARYLHEVRSGSVRVLVRLLSFDTKRALWWAEMHDLAGAHMHATMELLSLHVDQVHKTVAPIPPDIAAVLAKLLRDQGDAPPPDGSGRIVISSRLPRPSRDSGQSPRR